MIFNFDTFHYGTRYGIFQAVMRIRGILVRIRMRIRILGSECGSERPKN